MLLQLSILLIFGILSFRCMQSFALRTAKDVVLDLRENDSNAINNSEQRKLSGLVFHDELGRAGLVTPDQRRKFEMKMRLVPFFLVLSALAFRIIIGKADLASLLITGVVAFTIGVLWRRIQLSKLRNEYKKSLEFFLPLVMERIVMAVQAGLDILPAIGSVIKTVDDNQDGKANLDPVSRLLRLVYQLTEQGASFERSLRDIAERVESSSLRHAFLHLALAQKEGGELVMPLRELSDSTQIYFQESVEEDIAKMPVRATLPLLCTFAGLVIFFMASPIIQVTTMLASTMQGR